MVRFPEKNYLCILIEANLHEIFNMVQVEPVAVVLHEHDTDITV